MKYLILYAYPPQPDGMSLQGNMLYGGLLKNNREAMPCDWDSDLQKRWAYTSFKPGAAIGIGYWSYVPKLVLHPQKYGVKPVPWFVADGWVANYQDVLSSLPLVLTTSDWVTATYKRDGVDTKNFRTAHIGCDTNIFKPINKDEIMVKKIRELLGIKEDEKVVLTVGGDVTSKGSQEMFKALAIVDKEFSNWKYVCKAWGDNSSCSYHGKEEKKLLKELGIKDKVISLTGGFSVEFMPYFLNMCDIYAAPSRLEGFGMIQVEAQACGKPVISINEMGPKETIVHNKTGFLANVAKTVDLTQEKVYRWMGFKKNGVIIFDKPKTFEYRADINELAQYTLKLLTQDDFRDEMGSNARNHAVENFNYIDKARYIAKIVEETFDK